MTGSTRRDVLAAVGVALGGGLAGCNRLREGDDTRPRFDPSEMEAILTADPPEVERPAPVQPPGSAIDAGLERVDELLGAVPSSISVEQVPNGVVREEIEDRRERGEAERVAVETAPDRFRGTLQLRDARGASREAAVTYAAVGEDLAADVESERGRLRMRVGEELAGVEYVGDDVFRTLLLAARQEELLLGTQRRLRRGLRPAEPDVLEVGDLAGDVEYTDATIDAVHALAERHAETVGAGSDFRIAFETALERSTMTLDLADVPSTDTTPEDLVGAAADRMSVEHVVAHALRAVNRHSESIGPLFEADRLAAGLDEAYLLERDLRAFEAVLQRVDDGEFPELEAAEQVRAEREAAIEAADQVVGSIPDRSPGADVLARTVDQFGWIEQRIDYRLEQDRSSTLSMEYAQYAHLRARLEALPEAIDAVRGRLDAR